MFKKTWSGLLFYIPMIGLFGFIFRSLLLNISTNLLDWLDYPLMVWIIFQNIDHFSNHSLTGFFNSNIFYPFQDSLLFSDLLLPQSIMAIPLVFFIKNQILVFNLIFFITLFLNILAVTFFWKKLVANKLILAFAVLTTAFSPYFFLNYGHFQMISFWPLFFGLALLFSNKSLTAKSLFIIGILCTTQFLASVYLSIFMLFGIGLWFGLSLFYNRRDFSKVSSLIKSFFLFGLVFLVSAGPFIYKYIQVKNTYGIIRDYSEYVLYSAHITDYLFYTHYQSIWSNFWPISKWDSLNFHQLGESAGFPGLALLILALLGVFIYQKRKQVVSVVLPLDFNHIFFLWLTISGFIFSLGPRLNVNGFYASIPLPYLLIFKLVPLFEPIRANARWSFLFYFGLVYFAIQGLKKLDRKASLKLIVLFFSIVYFIEIVPINKQTEPKNYNAQVYQIINQYCSGQSQVLLEYPLTEFSENANIINNLTYKTQMMLASLQHKCLLVNGYTGYTPKDYDRFESQLFQAVEKNNSLEFNQLLAQRKVGLFKLNKDYLYQDRVATIEVLLKEEGANILLNDDHYIVAQIKYDK